MWYGNYSAFACGPNMAPQTPPPHTHTHTTPPPPPPPSRGVLFRLHKESSMQCDKENNVLLFSLREKTWLPSTPTSTPAIATAPPPHPYQALGFCSDFTKNAPCSMIRKIRKIMYSNTLSFSLRAKQIWPPLFGLFARPCSAISDTVIS